MMRGTAAVICCIVVTFCCWGNYGPLMHHGTAEMHGSRLRPFIGVGLAYFLTAVLVPCVFLCLRGERGNWTKPGTIWSLTAGAAGAIGALGIILAFSFHGNPIYVMPLVFGCAPVVNTFVSMGMARTYREAGPIFFAGVLAVAVGAAGVLYFKPGSPTETQILDLTVRQLLVITASIALTAFSWGSYGPMLHQGQMKMHGSRLRPFLCVGLAYFGIAVVVPLVLLGLWQEPGAWSLGGTLWSLGAGAAGAVGALGVIMAFNFGGKPIVVMPLVFGGAPIVNTFTSILERGSVGQVPVMFFFSLMLVIAGAVVVLVFAPRPPHKPAAESAPGGAKAKADSHDDALDQTAARRGESIPLDVSMERIAKNGTPNKNIQQEEV